MKWREIFLTIAATAFLAGCGKIKQIESVTGASSAPRETRFHLVDASKSAKNEHKKYEAAFQKLIECAGQGTRIVADSITDNPLSDASYPINELVPVFNEVTENKWKFDTQLHTVKRSLKEKTTKLFQTMVLGDYTPIIDSLIVAERVFAKYPGTQKRLVIFSDMLEDSDLAKFENRVRAPKEILDALRKEKRPIPNLSKVGVIVIGANAPMPQLYYETERFWREFFKELGANVEEYGAGLIDCPR